MATANLQTGKCCKIRKLYSLVQFPAGASSVELVDDAPTRKTILASARHAHAPRDATPSQRQQPVAAGRELMLECVTPDLGQPRANIWLWFKDGHSLETSTPTIEHRRRQTARTNSHQAGGADGAEDNVDNPTGTSEDLFASGAPSPAGAHQRPSAGDASDTNNSLAADDVASQPHQQSAASKIRLLASGRYLFIPSVHLAHKGNYSCVAVNRLGSGPRATDGPDVQIDSYQVRVALAPTFVQPLAPRTYWPEVSESADDAQTAITSGQGRRVELSCHVQCEPTCQIEWLRNNEPLDIKSAAPTNRQPISSSSSSAASPAASPSPASDAYVSYEIEQSIMDENEHKNMFKSIESRLVLQFAPIAGAHGHRTSGADVKTRGSLAHKIHERRMLLAKTNYTCQSSANSMGPSVKSTTKFIVQCEYIARYTMRTTQVHCRHRALMTATGQALATSGAGQEIARPDANVHRLILLCVCPHLAAARST